MIDFGRLLNIIHTNKSFILTTHINPDADAIGSELALAHFLKKLNKEVRIINFSSTPEYLKFLDRYQEIKKFEDTDLLNEADVIVALDFNQPGRMKFMSVNFINSSSYKICIDHHQNPSNFVDELFIDPDYSATGEIIYDLINYHNPNLFDQFIAEQIYAAIMTDTGSFRFNRITPKVHIIVARLIEFGANPTYIYNKIYNEISIEKLRLLGSAILNLKCIADGKICYMSITRKMLEEANACEEDVEGFVNHTLSIAKSEIGLLFLELEDGSKVSLRSKNSLKVNELAAIFGGGGHKNAAGIRFYNKSLDKTIKEVLDETVNFLKRES